MKILLRRESIRLENYDYSLPGYYFITICTQNRECLFGKIVDGKMVLNNAGKTVKNVWQSLPDCYPVGLDAFQIMPNHVHFVIQIVGATLVVAHSMGAGIKPPVWAGIKPPVWAGIKPAPTRLGDIIGAFKSLTTHEYINGVRNNGWKPFDKRLWQRNYWEHVIRTETDLNKIREYIKNNPQMWHRDRNNPKNLGFSSAQVDKRL